MSADAVPAAARRPADAHDYTRHGTTSLFAFARYRGNRTGHRQVLMDATVLASSASFDASIVRPYVARRTAAHLVMASPRARSQDARCHCPRWPGPKAAAGTSTLTPTSSSWLNQVERYLRAPERQEDQARHLSQRRALSGSTSLRSSTDTTPSANRCRWTKSADEILASVELLLPIQYPGTATRMYCELHCEL